MHEHRVLFIGFSPPMDLEAVLAITSVALFVYRITISRLITCLTNSPSQPFAAGSGSASKQVFIVISPHQKPNYTMSEITLATQCGSNF